jgi:hypothetical protein
MHVKGKRMLKAKEESEVISFPLSVFEAAIQKKIEKTGYYHSILIL